MSIIAKLETKANALLSGDNNLGINLAAKGWRFEWSNTTRTLGDCYHQRKIIRISKKLIQARTWEEQVNTLTHELAHAIDVDRRGTSDHSNVWRQIHIQLGGDGKRCSSISNPDAVDYKYFVYFTNAAGEIELVRGAHKMTRALQNMSTRYLTGRKAETLGKLKVATASEYKRIKSLNAGDQNVIVAPKAAPKPSVNVPAPKAVVKPAAKKTGKSIMTPQGEFASIYGAAKALGSYYSVIKGRVESKTNTSYYYL